MAIMRGVAQHPVQRQLTDHQRVVHRGLGLHLTGGGQDAERDWQVVGRARLLQVGGGEVDRHFAVREAAAGVADRGPHPLLTLPHRGIGQADQDHAGLAAAHIDLDLDEDAVEPDHGATVDLREHATLPTDDTRR
jgi:hypothetical protein